MEDPGFEALAPGPLRPTGPARGWEVQVTAREGVRDRVGAVCLADPGRARSGRQCLELRLPADASGFEYVTVGQRLRLQAGRVYEVSAWVRWPDGPDAPPAGAGPTSGIRSAIVSFWARFRDGQGDFAGRDVWLFDNRWTRLTFLLCPPEQALPTLVYISLLPNQLPAATSVLVDDFRLTDRGPIPRRPDKRSLILLDPDFAAQQPGAVRAPWQFEAIGGTRVRCEITGSRTGQCARITMPAGTPNTQSGQLRQRVHLSAGVRYTFACRITWENRAEGAQPPIVNLGVYDERSGTWYGPIDQPLRSEPGRQTYRFAHIPPASAPYRVYVQLNGWGNAGRPVTISVDEFRCDPSGAASDRAG